MQATWPSHAEHLPLPTFPSSAHLHKWPPPPPHPKPPFPHLHRLVLAGNHLLQLKVAVGSGLQALARRRVAGLCRRRPPRMVGGDAHPGACFVEQVDGLCGGRDGRIASSWVRERDRVGERGRVRRAPAALGPPPPGPRACAHPPTHLVRQEAIRDVARRQRHGGGQRLAGVDDAVVALVAVLRAVTTTGERVCGWVGEYADEGKRGAAWGVTEGMRMRAAQPATALPVQQNDRCRACQVLCVRDVQHRATQPRPCSRICCAPAAPPGWQGPPAPWARQPGLAESACGRCGRGEWGEGQGPVGRQAPTQPQRPRQAPRHPPPPGRLQHAHAACMPPPALAPMPAHSPLQRPTGRAAEQQQQQQEQQKGGAAAAHRSSAASRSMCLRCSSRVVAPMHCSSARASAGCSSMWGGVGGEMAGQWAWGTWPEQTCGARQVVAA